MSERVIVRREIPRAVVVRAPGPQGPPGVPGAGGGVDIPVGPVAPIGPEVDDLWMDTSGDPTVLRRWDGSEWEAVGGVGSAVGGVLAAQTEAYAGTSPNAETGSGVYRVTVLPNHVDTEGYHYAFGFQREGDAFPFLAVTDVGDWVISDGTFEPTNGPGGMAWPYGLQWAADGGITLTGGGRAVLRVGHEDLVFSAPDGGFLIAATEPDDDVFNGTDVALWLDYTPGATALMVKAKDSVGTVVRYAVVGDDDPRLTDARPPTGGAGGVLAGNYPNPGFAVNMATQAELDDEATARQAGDTGLDARLDAVETGKADLVGGVVPTSQMPAIATVQRRLVANQAARLALTAADVQPGDVAIQADIAETFLLVDVDPSLLASWKAVDHNAVASVNGQVGTVILGFADVGAVSTTDPRLSDQRVPTDGSVSTAKVADNAITLAKLADIASARFLGRTTGGVGDPELLTVAQAKTLLALVAGDLADFAEATDDRVAALLVGGANVSTFYDDTAGTLTITVAASVGKGIYGDGSDGNVTISGSTTLTRDMFYDTLVVQNGGVLNPGGFRICCRTLCQIDAGGKIANNGLSSTGGPGGSNTTAGTLGRGTPGGAGGTAAGANGTNSLIARGIGGTGGAGGTGTSGAGGTAGIVSALNAGDGVWRSVPQSVTGLLHNRTGSNLALDGGSGGGGGGGDGAQGGGAGGGAGPILIAAASLVLNGTIEAKGGNGFSPTAGNRGGGGGGGGGPILLTYNTRTGTGSTSVVGGAKGIKSGTGTDGTDGGASIVIEVVNV